jgi:hypothetical protein
MAKKRFLFATNYFSWSWTWVKRAIVLFVLILMMLYFHFLSPEGLVFKALFVLFSVVFLLAAPKNDLAVDDEFLYHFKRSLIPFFADVKKYKIDRIASIKCGGTYSSNFEIMDLLGYGYVNTIEVIFMDNSSISIEAPIYRKDMDKIVAKVHAVMRLKGANL